MSARALVWLTATTPQARERDRCHQGCAVKNVGDPTRDTQQLESCDADRNQVGTDQRSDYVEAADLNASTAEKRGGVRRQQELRGYTRIGRSDIAEQHDTGKSAEQPSQRIREEAHPAHANTRQMSRVDISADKQLVPAERK